MDNKNRLRAGWRNIYKLSLQDCRTETTAVSRGTSRLDCLLQEYSINMYYVSKQMEIAGCHRLTLPYESKCRKMHGHNWIVTVHCKAKELNAEGMVVDFKVIKEKIHGYLDHGDFNELLPFNPTAENIARWICEQVEHCYRVDIEESRNNKVTYIKDEE